MDAMMRERFQYGMRPRTEVAPPSFRRLLRSGERIGELKPLGRHFALNDARFPTGCDPHQFQATRGIAQVFFTLAGSRIVMIFS